MRLPTNLKYQNNWFPNYLKERTTDEQTDGLMDQSFTLTWFLTTTVFYEASVVKNFGEKLGGGGGGVTGPSTCYGPGNKLTQGGLDFPNGYT